MDSCSFQFSKFEVTVKERLETCNTKHLTETCYNAAGPAGTGVVHLHCLVVYGSMPTTTTQKQDNPAGSHQHNVNPSKTWIK
jgi:hypothetical protein